MVKNEEEIKIFLKEIKSENIFFKPHFYEKKREDRKYLSEEEIIKILRETDRFLGFQDQSRMKNEKYRMGFKLSGKYNMAIIGEIKDKTLYIITAWKTSKKWQKAIQK